MARRGRSRAPAGCEPIHSVGSGLEARVQRGAEVAELAAHLLVVQHVGRLEVSVQQRRRARVQVCAAGEDVGEPPEHPRRRGRLPARKVVAVPSSTSSTIWAGEAVYQVGAGSASASGRGQDEDLQNDSSSDAAFPIA